MITLEAENAEILGGAQISTNHSGFEGSGYVDFNADVGEGLSWEIDVTEPGNFQFDLRYALGADEGRAMVLEINGEPMDIDFSPTGAWDNWGVASVDTMLSPGANSILLYSIGDSGPNFDALAITPAGAIEGAEDTTTFQAEELTLVGDNIQSSNTESGAEGSGYVDFIDDAGEAIDLGFFSTFEGTTTLDIRYALAAGERTMSLEVNGEAIDVTFPATGSWTEWETYTVFLNLNAGENSIRLISTGDSGPNIDTFELGADITVLNTTTFQAEDLTLAGDNILTENIEAGAEGLGYVNFVDAAGEAIELDFSSTFERSTTVDIRYALATGERTMSLEVNGEAVDVTFKATGSWTDWGTLTVPITLDAGANSIRLISTGDSGPNIDTFEFNTDVSQGSTTLQAEQAVLEGEDLEVENDFAGAYSDEYVNFGTAGLEGIIWTYDATTAGNTNLDIRYALGANSRSVQLEINGVVINEDFTFDSTGAWDNWELASFNANLVEGENTIRLVTTGDGGPNVDALIIDGEAGPQFRDISDGTDLLQTDEDGVATDAVISLGIITDEPGDALENASVNTNTVRLIEAETGDVVEAAVNSTGGGDSISLTPSAELKANTMYRLEVDGVESLNGESYPVVTREFTTGEAAETPEIADVSFGASTVFSGEEFSSLAFDPSFTHLYGTTITGTLARWEVDADGGLSNMETWDVDPGQTLIGIHFDPNDAGRIWMTSNDTIFNVPADNYTGKIIYADLANDGSFGGTVTDYVIGLPRSIRDHVSNSLEFGDDGMLYMTQGSNSGMGAPDFAWGNRAEDPLSAAVLQINPNLDAPDGGFNVSPETRYDAEAPDAPVTVYASGVRNAYDLVWHSNGQLYSANNGSAAGSNSPDDPNTAIDETIDGGSTQNDYLYNVVEGGYYGHPNPTREEWIRDGGNPTAGDDVAEVPEYVVGTNPEDNYQGFAYDFGQKRSPNGTIEYKSDAFNAGIEGSLMVAEFSGGDRILGLEVDAAGNIVGDFVVASGLDNPLDLAVHEPTGRIYVAEYGDLFTIGDGTITVLEPDASASAPSEVTFTIQAEDALSSGDAFIASDHPGAEGGAYVDFVAATGDALEWQFNLDEADEGATLSFRYALGAGQRAMALEVNGEIVDDTFTFDETGSWVTWANAEISLSLEAGPNSVRLIANGDSGPNIDSLNISGIGEALATTIGAVTFVNDRGIDSLGDTFHFHEAEEPAFNAVDKDTRSIEIRNDGEGTLEISLIEITGAQFSIVNPSQIEAQSLEVGESIFVDVAFDAETRDIYQGELVVHSNDFDSPTASVDLRGVWTPGHKGSLEPMIQDIIELFGMATSEDGSIVQQDELSVFRGTPTLIDEDASVVIDRVEEQAYYFTAANQDEDVVIHHLSSFKGVESPSVMVVDAFNYDPSMGDVNDTAAFTELGEIGQMRQVGDQANTILPEFSDGTLATMSFSTDADAFSFEVNGRDADPGRFNDLQGLRILEVYELDTGERIQDTFLVTMDFARIGANYDYQDATYLVSNVEVFDFI